MKAIILVTLKKQTTGEYIIEILHNNHKSLYIFRIGINNPHQFFDLFDPTEIESGFKVVFKLWPNVITMDQDLKSQLTVTERRCRFSDEVPENMTLFNMYSPSACKFDCMVKYR